MTEGQRLAFLVRHLCGDNQADFARRTGIGKSTLNRLVRENGRKFGVHLTDTYISKIMTAFPEVDEKWLRTGIGEPGDISIPVVRARYLTIIKERDKEIEELKAENARLNRIIDRLLGNPTGK